MNQKVEREKVASTSGDVLEVQIAKLRGLFPEAVVEGKIDFDKLKATPAARPNRDRGGSRFLGLAKMMR